MNRRDWKIAWTLAGAIITVLTLFGVEDFAGWQSRTPLWAQVVPLLSLQVPIAIALWAVIDEHVSDESDNASPDLSASMVRADAGHTYLAFMVLSPIHGLLLLPEGSDFRYGSVTDRVAR